MLIPYLQYHLSLVGLLITPSNAVHVLSFPAGPCKGHLFRTLTFWVMRHLVQPCAGVQKQHLPEGHQQAAGCLPPSVQQQNKAEAACHVWGFLDSVVYIWTQNVFTQGMQCGLPFPVYHGAFMRDGNVLHISIIFEAHVDMSLHLLQSDFKIMSVVLKISTNITCETILH